MSIAMTGFRGEVVLPKDVDYDRSRSVWNAMHDRRPAVILRCRDREDVRAAVAYAREADLEIAVRGGGHSIPGHGVCQDGVVIDLGGMNTVSVDPVSRRAVVGGGALLGDVDRATQRHGLVVPAGVVSHTGVGGLTLGGGVGRLMRRFGLTIDSLVSADVVAADGSVLHASVDEHPDLFWAVRGGGGNFGVVTSFEFALHPLTEIFILQTWHELGAAQELLGRAQLEMADDAPEELLWTSFVRKGHAQAWMPDDAVGEPGIFSMIEWSGAPEIGADILGNLERVTAPRASSLNLVPFEHIQTADDELFRHGLLSYMKASFTDQLGPDLIDVVADRARSLRSHLTQVELLAMGGAIGRVPVTATAFAHRDARWLVNILATWSDPADTDYEIEWSKQTHIAIAPLATGGAYVNFMGGDETSSEWTAYGPTLQRLQEVKGVYDPDNVFRLNQNVLPVAAALS